MDWLSVWMMIWVDKDVICTCRYEFDIWNWCECVKITKKNLKRTLPTLSTKDCECTIPISPLSERPRRSMFYVMIDWCNLKIFEIEGWERKSIRHTSSVLNRFKESELSVNGWPTPQSQRVVASRRQDEKNSGDNSTVCQFEPRQTSIDFLNLNWECHMWLDESVGALVVVTRWHTHRRTSVVVGLCCLWRLCFEDAFTNGSPWVRTKIRSEIDILMKNAVPCVCK